MSRSERVPKAREAIKVEVSSRVLVTKTCFNLTQEAERVWPEQNVTNLDMSK